MNSIGIKVLRCSAVVLAGVALMIGMVKFFDRPVTQEEVTAMKQGGPAPAQPILRELPPPSDDDAKQALQFGRIYQTTFDCMKVATGSNEDIICRDQKLAEKDVQLGELIARMKASPDLDQKHVTAVLRKFWNIRATCKTADCLDEWYNIAIAKSNEALQGGRQKIASTQ